MGRIFILLMSIPVYSMAQDHYVVTIEDIEDRVIHMEATIQVQGELMMSPAGADHLELGWATFMDSIRAFIGDERIGIQRTPGGGLAFERDVIGSTIELSYRIRIKHDQQQWPFGSKEAAYVKSGMLMATGNALFVTQLEMDSAIVEFKVPDHYQVASAWQGEAHGPYMVKGAEELVWTVLAVGEFERSSFPSGDMEVVLLYGHALSDHAELMQRTTQRTVQAYGEIFGGAPKTRSAHGGTYLQVVNVDTGYVGGGAAFTNSISIMLNKPPEPCPDIASTCWHHILVHELGHLWIGHSLRSDDKDQWFNEGFNDLLAFRIQMELGLFKVSHWETLLELKEKEYQTALSKAEVSLEEAGSDKGRYYDLVYAGGFIFADRLDRALLQHTNREKGLKELMRVLYSKYAGTEQLVDRDLLQKEAEDSCKCDLVGEFKMLDSPRP